MHRCLRVTDIFYYILEFIILDLWDEDHWWRGYGDYWVGNPTLAALARTCRAFYDPALNVLWRNQLTLGPLIKTLPSDAIKEVIEDGLPEYLFHHLSLKRPLTESDWTRFDSYASRIRNLGFYLVEFEDQEQHAWSEPQLREDSRRPVIRETIAQLAMYRRKPFLLPNLVRLRWTYLNIHYIPYIPMFLSRNLTMLSIAFHPSDDIGSGDDYTPEMYDEIVPILEALVEACPSLVDLEIWPEQEDNVKELSLVFAHGCKQLEGFTVSSSSAWNKDSVRLLADKPSLRRCFLTLDEEMASNLQLLRYEALRYPFPSLESVFIIAPGLPTFTELIKWMTTCRLRIVTLEFTERTYPEEVQELFSVLRDRGGKTTLQVLNVTTRADRKWTLRSKEDAFTIDTVAPLLDCPRLRVLRIGIPLMTYINDDELRLMVDSWPLLVDFRLQEGWGCNMPSEVTWAGVAYVVYRCPQLLTLYISFNTKLDNIEEMTSKPDFKPAPYLRHIHTLDSVFCDAEFFARCAHKLSPVFIQIDGYGWHEIDDGVHLPPEKDPYAFYEEVTELLWQMQFPDRPRRTEAEEMNPWGVHQDVEPWVTGPPTFTVVEDASEGNPVSSWFKSMCAVA